MPKFGTKNALFAYFWAGIWKQYCHIWNQQPWICLIANFQKKTKMPKFGTKNALFGYFWAEIWKQYSHIWNQHSRICLTSKFCENMKMLKFGTKKSLLGYFWVRILKNYCHIWNQHPQICHKWVFNWYSEFWYRGPLVLNVRGPLFLKVEVRVRFIKYASSNCRKINCVYSRT